MNADQASAKAVLTAAGQTVKLTAHALGPYNPALGLSVPVDTVTTTIGVVLPLSRGLMHMPGTDIQNGDRQLLLPGDIVQPPINTTVTIGGTDSTIVEVNPLSPAGVTLLYDCMIRGGLIPKAASTNGKLDFSSSNQSGLLVLLIDEVI